MNRHAFAWVSLAFLLTGACQSATLVLRNGTILTLDDRLGTVSALAVRDDRILAVGDEEAVARHIGPQTKVIDLGGAFAMPGFIEGHGHFTSLGRSKMILDLRAVRNWDEVIDKVRAAVAKAHPGEWIVGRGWHQEKWDRPPEKQVEGFPAHEGVSAVSPDNPVYLTHASGHLCFVNAKAMALAGIAADTPDPPGGEILRDDTGQPIGILRETAQGLVERVYQAQIERSPQAEKARLRRMIRLADEECLRKGVTTFEDAGSSFRTIDVMKEMAAAGQIGVRLWVMVHEPNDRLREKLDAYRLIGFADHHLTVRAIKSYIDGALGSRGAWLLEPYNDAPQSRGLNTVPLEELAETARIARAHGFQLCVHAIGDRANREVLNLYEQTFPTRGALRSARWRIEHAQHLHPDDIPRFGRLGVIAAMQGIHCTSDAPFVIARLGERRAREGAYAWRSLIDSGAVVMNGTDTPVEDVAPIACFYASVTRKLPDGSRFFPQQCMTRPEALRSYTINAAYGAFEEDVKGTLTPGKLADVVVLSR
ncbi:MAG: amidohydrolase, partial [Planctomycetota bacterium]